MPHQEPQPAPMPDQLDLKASVVPQPDGTVSLVLHQIKPQHLQQVLQQLSDPSTIDQFVAGMNAEFDRREQIKEN
jgi:hypothetical protein